jgi:hypothetical protein
MTQTATNIGADIRPVARGSRVRPWIALAAAAAVFAFGLFGVGARISGAARSGARTRAAGRRSRP